MQSTQLRWRFIVVDLKEVSSYELAALAISPFTTCSLPGPLRTVLTVCFVLQATSDVYVRFKQSGMLTMSKMFALASLDACEVVVLNARLAADVSSSM